MSVLGSVKLPVNNAKQVRCSVPTPAKVVSSGRRTARQHARYVPDVVVLAHALSFGPSQEAAAGVDVKPRRSTICRAAAPVIERVASTPSLREDVRNIAIIAHVDHGKTTLVDAMLRQSNVFRDNQAMAERIMDSNTLERERGITILAKNTAVTYHGKKINIIDTPGHADFGGEVERVLNMCDGVLLLVDSVEGPMPQTRFVLRKALGLKKKVIVVINKIDRPAARPDWVIDQTFDLFVDLGADDEQCDFPVVYASGVNGIAGLKADNMSANLEPLFEAIVNEVEAPTVDAEAPLQMLCANIDYDEHKGRIAIGRIVSGTVKKGQQVTLCSSLEEGSRIGKLTDLYVYSNFNRVPIEEVKAGDICAICGLPDIKIGETICERGVPNALPTIQVEEPTVSMVFKVNTSPFAGKEGKFVTSRNLKDRLDRELERNLALRVTAGDTSDQFVVSGRGTLHLGILIENMRREGYEFEIGAPKVITKEINGKKYEPYEDAIVEVPETFVGNVVELFAQRKGEMVDMQPGGGLSISRITFKIATRGLLGLKNSLLTATKGMAVMNSVFNAYEPVASDIKMRENGSLIAFETGSVTAYALETAQERGLMFVKPQDEVYQGQCIGMSNKAGDLPINVCKTKKLTNMRASGSDIKTVLDEPRMMSLDDALEYINDDEQVEVTPKNVRIRKSPDAKKRR